MLRSRSAKRDELVRGIDRWDPIAFILATHGLGLVIAGGTGNPLPIAILTGTLAVMRLGISWIAPRETRPLWRLASSYLSIVLAYTVLVLDGGVDSPFFFWILLLLGWQVLTFNRRQFTTLGGFTLVGYVLVLIVTMDAAASSVARLFLLAAFTLTLLIGRISLDRGEADIARLDDMLVTVIRGAPMAIAVFDADRDTLLYANRSAHELGITDHDSMARLLLVEGSPTKVTTLAELVRGSGFQAHDPRPFRRIGSTQAEYQIGFHARQSDDAAPMVLVYGIPLDRPLGPL